MRTPRGNKLTAVEVVIFSAVSMIFLNSVYNLFTDGSFTGSDTGRKPLMATRDSAGASRAIAASPDSAAFAPYETRCQSAGEIFETAAAKVRVLGPLCGAGRADSAPEVLVASKIENASTRYVATVFSDRESGKFSTDFIPLASGANRILMEFRYKSGKVYPVELTVVKR